MIEMSKKYKTRDGRDVRVICTDIESNRYPVVVSIFHSNEEVVYTCREDGRHSSDTDHNLDLIEIKTVKYRLCLINREVGGCFVSVSHWVECYDYTEVERSPNFVKWLTDWVEVEV